MRSGPRNWPWWVLYAVVAVVAFGARLLLMLRGGGLHGVGGYDDGVYYAAADALVHGRLPYADFLFIQPPGVVAATAPFAWIGTFTSDATGFAIARVGFMIVGAVNAVLVTAILRRFGFVSAAIGGLVYALSFVAAYGERSVLLEPFGTLGILIALLVVTKPSLRRSTWWLMGGGAAAGIATGFKIWYIVPALIIVAFAGRGWWKVLVGGIVGACALYLPFFLAAPATTFREVVSDQLGRGKATVAITERLHQIMGDFPVPQTLAHNGFGPIKLTAILVLMMVVAAIVTLTVRGARVFVALLAADTALLLVTPSFFLHYTALTSPMLALVLGVGYGRLISMIPVTSVRYAVAAVLVVMLGVANSHNIMRGAGETAPTAEISAATQRVRGCIVADDPTMLAVTNNLSRSLTRGCPLWPDVTGYTYGPYKDIMTDGQAVTRPKNAAWQRAIVSYLTSGQAVIVSRSSTGLSGASRRLVQAGTPLYSGAGVGVFRTPVHVGG